MAVIYQTINLINGKKYVGRDARNIPSYFGSGMVLKRAIKKYGKKNFKKEILEYCKKENIIEREQYWLDKTNAYKNKNFYNVSPLARGGDVLDHIPGGRAKALKRRTKNNPDMYKKVVATRRKNGSYNVSESTKKLISKNNKSGTISVRAKLSAINLKNSPTAKKYTIEDTNTGEIFILEKMPEVEQFVKQYNTNNQIKYRERVNWWKLLYEGSSKNMKIISKERLNRR